MSDLANFDDILEHVGEFGLYQCYLVGLLYVPALFMGMQSLSYVFISATPKHRCYVDVCDNGSTLFEEPFLNWTIPWDSSKHAYSSCKSFEMVNPNNGSAWLNEVIKDRDACQKGNFNSDKANACDRWLFDSSTFRSTSVTEWQLVCDQSYLVAMSQSILMLGTMIGSIVFGTIADRYGRMTSFVLSVLTLACSSTLISFIPYYPLFLVMKLIIGGGNQGLYMTSFVMSMELVGKSKRAYCGTLVFVCYATGEALLGVLAFFIRDWKILQLVISVPIFCFCSYKWLVPESPRWLVSKGDVTRSTSILENIARSNNNSVPYDKIRMITSLRDENDKSNSGIAHNISQILQARRLTYRLVCISFAWMLITVVYFGLSISSVNLEGNRFWNFVVMCAIEIPASVLGSILLARIGRRLPLAIFLVTGGAASFLLYFVPSMPRYIWLAIALSLVSKFGASAAYSIVYIYTAELFPTMMRNNVIGFCGMLGHIGGVIAPYVEDLRIYNPVLPIVVYGICSVAAGLAALILPETMNRKLPDNVKEALELGV